MAKKITIITSLMMIYLLYNYSVSKGYPLLFLLIGLAILSFSISKIYLDYHFVKEETFEEVEKNINRIEENNGIFEYKNDGFYIKQKKHVDFVKWSDVDSITHFNLNMLKHVQQDGIEIATTNKIYKIHNNDQQTIGIEKFEIEMNKNLIFSTIYESEILSDGSSRTPLYIKPLV